MFYYVYILLCKDGLPYIGCSNDLKDRINRHQKGQVPSTKKRLPIKIIAYFAFNSETITRNFEKYFKSGSGRLFMRKHNLVKC